MSVLSPFPEEMNPGAGKAPGLGILFDNCTGITNVYHKERRSLKRP